MPTPPRNRAITAEAQLAGTRSGCRGDRFWRVLLVLMLLVLLAVSGARVIKKAQKGAGAFNRWGAVQTAGIFDGRMIYYHEADPQEGFPYVPAVALAISEHYTLGPVASSIVFFLVKFAIVCWILYVVVTFCRLTYGNWPSWASCLMFLLVGGSGQEARLRQRRAVTLMSAATFLLATQLHSVGATYARWQIASSLFGGGGFRASARNVQVGPETHSVSRSRPRCPSQMALYEKGNIAPRLGSVSWIRKLDCGVSQVRHGIAAAMFIGEGTTDAFCESISDFAALSRRSYLRCHAHRPTVAASQSQRGANSLLASFSCWGS